MANHNNGLITDSMRRLSFDITRRCNLNCKWCSRGDAQNEDITKEIVDKAIAEMKGKYIASVRFLAESHF